MNHPLLSSVKKVLLDALSPSLQKLEINFRPKAHNFRTQLTETPKNRPGVVLPLPKKCGLCGSHLVGYDELNVVTCDNCESILSVSGRWHNSWCGNIKPLAEDLARARELLSKRFPP
jgi:hypothetical protein